MSDRERPFVTGPNGMPILPAPNRMALRPAAFRRACPPGCYITCERPWVLPTAEARRWRLRLRSPLLSDGS